MQTAITTGGAMPTERVRRESTDSRFSLDRDVFTDQVRNEDIEILEVTIVEILEYVIEKELWMSS